MFAQTSSMEQPNNLTELNKPEMTSTGSDFQTPERPRDLSATNTEGPRRGLDFSTGGDQVETETTLPTTAVHPREDVEEDQREAENLRMKISLDEATDWNNTSVDTLERGLRSPLPIILLSNVDSLCNKMKELRHLITTNRDFADSSVLCFTESWLTDATPNSAVQLTGFQLLRADRDPKLSCKKKGGGICFYINRGWCSDVKEISRSCSPDLETFFITCKPFDSPREFDSFILAGVYIPPKADVRNAQSELGDQIRGVECVSSTVIVLGNFNKANLSHKLPEYEQFVKCPTRGEKTLDHCYSTISKAYHAVSHPALGRSDHVLIHLIPAYTLKRKRSKPAVL